MGHNECLSGFSSVHSPGVAGDYSSIGKDCKRGGSPEAIVFSKSVIGQGIK